MQLDPQCQQAENFPIVAWNTPIHRNYV